MEVTRNLEPNDNFRYKVRKTANDNDITLILDECNSGWKTNGGLHANYGVEPILQYLVRHWAMAMPLLQSSEKRRYAACSG